MSSSSLISEEKSKINLTPRLEDLRSHFDIERKKARLSKISELESLEGFGKTSLMPQNST